MFRCDRVLEVGDCDRCGAVLLVLDLQFEWEEVREARILNSRQWGFGLGDRACVWAESGEGLDISDLLREAWSDDGLRVAGVGRAEKGWRGSDVTKGVSGPESAEIGFLQ